MNDKTLELLNRLADKFGTTVEHLWGVLVKQAYVGAVAHSVKYVIWFFLIAGVLSLTVSAAKTALRDKEPTIRAIIFGIACIAALIWTCYFMSELPWLITRFVNPEYWALCEII